MKLTQYAMNFSVLLVAGCLALSETKAETFTGQVIGIADGDTITILLADGGQRVPRKIRIAGIDAPEGKQPFGSSAKQTMSALAFGREGTAECSNIDRYQRDVCKVTVEGRDIGLEMIRAGMAWHFKRYQRNQSKTDRKAYADEEENAQANRVGLWKSLDAIPPWLWRKKISARAS
jgi:endonuclease YncB( thermonuclease family)